MSLRMDIVSRCADEAGKKLMRKLVSKAGRKAFFSALSGLIQEYFTFDRLCINLYDQHSEMLTYFTAAEGTVVSTLSPVRPADPSGTVAGHVIATRKPVIITDFARYFSEAPVHPIAEAGLTVTMAFPLILDNEIIATLHCSFAKKPQNLYEITAFFLELTPAVAICLGAVLSLEQTDTAVSRIQPRLSPEAAECEKIVCYSKAMRKVIRRLDAVAGLDVPLLLLGETGTGKSLFAQEIHRRSPRKERPFVRVNCPGLVTTLFESELFGHARGAFTGALAKRAGRFELADGGSLFLDEIAELAPAMQSKLLQVLEDGSFERVGESVPLRADVRIIAATNVDVGAAVAEGGLRSDLFFRLAFFSITLPPLRERKEDIGPLIALISKQASGNLGLPRTAFSPAVLRPLLRHDWPGNVRELRNTINHLAICQSVYGRLTPADVESVLAENRLHTVAPRCAPPAGATRTPRVLPPKRRTAPFAEEDETLAGAERRHILEVLSRTGGLVSGPKGAAARLGLPRSTLQHRMRKLGIA
ncbi:MAG: sigma 54-interacting transcriptional regulator [Desulfovibrio sp.]|jgi:transcriptional regulator with GAF, ATPase, and Fis domain|nr:sigma 54-interacting transcriptional regulator [Desulfovibrio sp.]